MLQSVAVWEIESAFRRVLGLRCFYKICLSAGEAMRTYKVLQRQGYHVPVTYDMQADYLFFTHPKLSVLLQVVVKQTDKGTLLKLEVAGNALRWVQPGETPTVYDDMFPTEPPPPVRPDLRIPCGWGHYGGASSSDGCATRHYENAYEEMSLGSIAELCDVTQFILDEHFDLDTGRLDNLQLTSFGCDYTWPMSEHEFWADFPFDKMRPFVRRYFGHEPYFATQREIFFADGRVETQQPQPPGPPRRG